MRMEELSREQKKGHAVCIPFPAQGHINPMLKLSKILHSRGFHITFVHTLFNRNRLLRTRGPNSLDGLPSFHFEAIPDGLPPTTEEDSTQDIPNLCRSTEVNCLQPIRELIGRVNDNSGVPRITCIIYDAAMTFTADVAEELGVPGVVLFTASACGLLGYAQYDCLLQLGLVPFKDEKFLTNGDLERVLEFVPEAMKGIKLKYIPSFMRITNPNDFMFSFTLRSLQNMKRACALLFNAFDALDHDVLQSLSSKFPPLYTIGPLHLLEPEKTNSIGSNLWKEDPDCINWLDSYGPRSVVYVNFGSITVMTNEQLVEFAWGLANSKHPFLWITRPDLVTGESAVLPLEFTQETKNREFITSWCNQEQVLAHTAIGGFLTHCGWNSTLESICNGVPMICWPFFSEQQTNCWFICRKWGIGMEIDGNVKRSEVERQVKEMMEGREMKRKAMEWKMMAEEATAIPNGSSYCNFDHLIAKILSQN